MEKPWTRRSSSKGVKHSAAPSGRLDCKHKPKVEEWHQPTICMKVGEALEGMAAELEEVIRSSKVEGVGGYGVLVVEEEETVVLSESLVVMSI